MIKNNDLMRSYNQYIKQQKLGHINIHFVQRILLSFIFIFSFILLGINLFFIYSKKKVNKTLFVFPFNNKEPMGSIITELRKLNHSRIIVYPKALPIFPLLLLKDFLYLLCTKPLWTLRNLDFFGALSIKVSKYYGYKKKYAISKLLLFQEYSFYSSYLTYIFESEDGSLYNLMHGIPGEEASYFRFSKCFVWGEYFKNYYILNNAEKNQFIIVSSIYHAKLKMQKNSSMAVYDIIYALQGDRYSDITSTKIVLDVLQQVQRDFGLKVAVKQHPIYPSSVPIPSKFLEIDISPFDSIFSSKMLISHFSTMLLDAKVLDKKVLAFLSKEQKGMVAYLDNNEVVFDKNELYKEIVTLFNTTKGMKLSKNIIDFDLNTVEIIENEIS